MNNASSMGEPNRQPLSNHPKLEDRYQGRVQLALEFALTIDYFDDLVYLRHLYDYCLGHEPFAFVLKKIAREGKKMATKYSKDKYASVKSLKNEPLSQLTPGLKKRKLDEGKDETLAPLFLFVDYLSSEEKVVVANSKVDSIEAKSLKLRKDLIMAMDQAMKAKEKYFKGFELLRRWMIKHHSQVADFANLDFEAIDTEILVDETKKKEGEIVADATEGDGTTTGGVVDEAHMDKDHVEEVITAP
nr:hypothetical protein CFP56_32969 [Quercus suber]